MSSKTSDANSKSPNKRKTPELDDDEHEEDRKSSDQDDYAMEPQEDDDDEWLDAPKAFGKSHVGGRKKAQSGTACEKHKRWKKRCPDTCPMRDSNWKKIQEEMVPVQESAPWSGDDISKFVSSVRAKLSGKFGSQTNKVITSFEDVLLSAKNVMKPNNHEERMALVRWCLNELRLEGSPTRVLDLIDRTCDHMNFYEEYTAEVEDYHGNEDGEEPSEQEDEFDVDEEFVVDGRRNYDDVEVHSSTYLTSKRRRDRGGANKSRKVSKMATIACERHTSLHARCPPNCPERRPAKAHPRSTKRLKLEDEDSGLSPPSHEEDDSKFSPGITTRAGRVVKSSMIDGTNNNMLNFSYSSGSKNSFALEEEHFDQSFETSPRDHYQSFYHSNNNNNSNEGTPASSPTSVRRQVNVNHNNSSNHHNNRKYLPQACERHRMLHARCPANCPDRLRRAEEYAIEVDP